MRRANRVKHHQLTPDERYQSVIVTKFINYVMRNGKKQTASNIVYQAFKIVEDSLNKPPLQVFEQALTNVSPLLEVKSRRIGGATYQVPVEVRPERKIMLSLRWILEAVRAKQGKPMAEFLATEIMDAYNKTGTAIKRREDMHKSAEANKAFAHYARF